jgi:hypothetical protein
LLVKGCIPLRFKQKRTGIGMTWDRIYRIMLVTGMALVFFMVGCASGREGRGRIIGQSSRGEKVTIERLTEDFAKYDVYYSGVKPTVAESVLFCPKEGDTKITPDKWWIKVKEQAELKNIVKWMNTITYYHKTVPNVLSVLGPNSRLFGFVYCYNIPIETRVVSETDLIVYAPVN